MADAPDRQASRKRHLTTQERGEALDMLEQGQRSQAAVAEAFGVSVSTIARLKQQGRADPRSTTGGALLTCRLSQEEFEGFDQAWEAAGLASRSDAVRVLVRRAAGLFEPDHREIGAWAEVAHQLRGVATNINQMAKAANRGQIAWGAEERAEMRDLAKGVHDLEVRLRRLSQGARQASAARKALVEARRALSGQEGRGEGRGGAGEAGHG